MTLQDLKSKIWSACDVLRSQGLHITDYMEQITYLMFLKNLDEKEENDKELDKALGREHKPLFDDEKYYWKNWTQKSGRPLVKFVKDDLFPKLTDINGRNPIVKKIFKDAVFNIEEPQALKKVIGIIDSIQFYKQPIDVKGATYEFLLSKLAEAGAAGEFFTPRHIIKAMIEIVDPKIGETICDPAMGTGGFLIGALNHILEANGDGHGDGRNLTNEQFAFLHDETFFGYEQNRKTYRMALMNMYLHGANNPKLERINTLGDGTHTERKYDVVFANPPYGGKIDNVRDNFTISTNKTELLFLQHIIQTLKEGGRAGVILPEGVMFQSGAAQKIREILLSQCETFTVVSMPAGVFQPYTGVKTDLLFFKKGTGTQKVWFFDVKNDGFDLGSQRRPIKQDDLPMLWDKFPFKGKNDFTPPKSEKELAKAESEKSWWADLEEIKENNWSLVAGKYKKRKIDSEFDIVPLGDVCKIVGGYAFKSSDYVDNGIALIRIGDFGDGKIKLSNCRYLPSEFLEKYDNYKLNKDDILIAMTGATVGKVGMVSKDNLPALLNQRVGKYDIKEKTKILPEFLFYVVSSEYYKEKVLSLAIGGAQPNISSKQLESIEIPLPPIEKQREIVQKLNQKREIVNEASSLIEKIERERANTQEIFDELDCEWAELGSIATTIKDGDWLESQVQSDSGFRIIQTGNIGFGEYLDKAEKSRFISEDTFNTLNCTEVFEGDVVVSRLPKPVGRATILPLLENRSVTVVDCAIIKFNTDLIMPDYFIAFSMSPSYYEQVEKYLTGSSRQRISRTNLSKIKVPIPSKEKQEDIIALYKNKNVLIENLRKNISEMEKSTQSIVTTLFEK